MSVLVGDGRFSGVPYDPSEFIEAVDLMLYEQQLDLHYQPIFSAHTGNIVGVEALLRQNRPGVGPVSAEQLVRAAERSGHISHIGSWVLDQVCKKVSDWGGLTEDPTFAVSVNLSPTEVGNPMIVTRLLHRITDHGVVPGQLNIELTESEAIADIDSVRSGLTRLRDAGVSVSLDDFGTGMSALARLHELPLDAIKIDRSFIAGFGRDNRAEEVVTHICELAAALDLRTVAEGVETRLQWKQIVASGCDQGQGYYLSPPVSADAIEEILRGHSEWNISSHGQGTLWAL